MANEDKKPEIKKPKFNAYWIYIGVILLIVGFQFFGGSSWTQPNKISQIDFEQYLVDGDVERIEVVTNLRTVKVYLTPEAKAKEIHNRKKGSNLLKPGPNDPNYEFEIGDLQNFENKFQALRAENDLNTGYGFDQDENFFGDVLLTLLPFVVIIGIWIFIMRRMSSGAGGGAGGQIFNIGKSKAKLFDEKTDVKTSFKDVAGLEGAKEEVQEIVDFLKNPTKYTSPEVLPGVLLLGFYPPGK
ncbi:MAG: ATP-dependent metallopeptidase FtsH/Yme1/Tma family protein, partial [Bacteroidota bacterium]